MFTLGLTAFIADISSPETRALRFGLMFIFTSCGKPIGPLLGAYLFETGNNNAFLQNLQTKKIITAFLIGGYVCVFSAGAVGYLITAIILYAFIRHYSWNPPKSQVKMIANKTNISA